MNEFIEKLIGRVEDVIDGLEVYTAGRTNTLKVNMSVLQLQRYINRLKEINQLAEEYKHCDLCYLGSPCEYQNENAKLPNKLLAYENGWIPVSDKLPEKAGKYLVTIREGGIVHTTVRRFNPKPKHPQQNEPIFTKYLPFYSGWERATRGVVAWKELPEPFKPKGE